MAEDEDRGIDRLFELPPEEFVPARDELAARLRSQGDREAARRVKQLRRPTVAAWAVNQVVRRHPDEVAALLDSGSELRRAQRRLLSGVKDAGLRAATSQRRRLLEGLVDRADELLEQGGRGPSAHREDVHATLEAASADEDAAETVRQGRLSKALPRPAGFGSLAGLASVLDEREPAPAAADGDEGRHGRRAELDTATRALEAARRLATDAAASADRAERDAHGRRRDADNASTEADRLERRARTARRQADNAAAYAAAAADDADRLRRVADRRAREVEHAERRVKDLRARLRS